MNPRQPRTLLVILALVVLCVILGSRLWRSSVPPEGGGPVLAVSQASNGVVEAVVSADTNAPVAGASAGAPAEADAGSTNAVSPPVESPGGEIPPVVAAGDAASGTNTVAGASTNSVQLSFQGARIEMVVEWLAKTTGKSVVKHPRVQCQLTIVSSGTLPFRDALSLVYRALALEGFATIESRDAILIVPEGQEPKLPPELLTDAHAEIPEGRQSLIKVFPLQHVQAGELSERVRVVLSEKASVDVDSRSNQLIVTDTTDNIRLVSELIRELDVVSPGDTVVELYALKHVPADELAELLGLILNAKAGAAAAPVSPRRTPSPPVPNRPGMPGGEGPMPAAASPTPPSGASSSGPEGVRLWADRTVNRLIVAAPKSRVAEIKELIDVLDQEKPQDVTLRVIPLQHVSAQDLVREIAPLYQKMSGQTLKDTIEVAANSRANSLIVLSGEANFRAIRTLVATLDTENAQAKVMRAFPLKNADAEDVARQLQELNEDQGSGMSRYVYYYTSRPSGESEKLSVVADRRRNTVVVQAPPSAMESVAEMIAILDEPVADDSLAPRIFPLRYVSATDIEDVLNELFLKKQQERSYYDYFYYDPYGGSSSSQDQNAGRLYGKVRITSEPYSNSIIVTSNSPENLTAVEAVLKQLDVPSQAGETTIRLELRFGQAIEIAKGVNILFAKAGSPPLRPVNQPGVPQDMRNQQQQQRSSNPSGFELEAEEVEEAYYPWIGGQQESYRSIDGRSSVRPISDLVGRVRVVPDRRSNSLLITSNVHLLPQVLKLIAELDVPTPQVLLEARIVAVSTDFREKLGVRWSPDGSQVFSAEDMDGSILANVNAQYRDVFLGGALPDALRTGVLDSTINLDFLIQFLQKNVELKVLAEPQINVADNEIGRLFVGSKVPYLAGSLNTDVGGRNDTYDYRDVGIILEVTPHINNDKEVTLRVHTESSNIREGEMLFGGLIFDTRDFRTEVTVKNGETLVLGGIIQTEEGKTVRKVPLLGDIPLLGYLFKKKDTVSRDTELMVFLRPRVSRTPAEAAEMLEGVQRRTPMIRDWTRKMEAEKEVEARAAAGNEVQ